MRTRWIASLISLSLASTHAARAQEALWFTPSQPTAATTQPTPEEQSFAERFGGLLSKPNNQSAAANPPLNNASKALDNKQPTAISPASGQRSAGVRDFEIPWSLTATAPFDFDQHATLLKGSRSTSSIKGHGAQVRPMAAQVRPNYVPPPTVTSAAPVVLPTAERAPLPAGPTVVETVPWEKDRLTSNKAPAGVQAKNAPVMPLSPSVLPSPSIAQSTSSKLNAQTASPPPAIEPKPLALAVKPLSPATPPVTPTITSGESLIVPIPDEKLGQAIVRQVPSEAVVAPRPVAPTLPAGSGRLASSPIQLAVPNQYVFVDDQPSASDKTGPAVVPAPPVTERLTDQADNQTTADQSAALSTPSQDTSRKPAAAESPLLTTESMIGPLKGAEELFHRLGQESDMRQTAARIESGPRGDASNFAWMPAAYTWISPALYHYPLYFEQPNLERYGIGHRPVVQPMASSIHFFGSIPLVPYKTLTHHPRERVYTLGNLRPGNCVPVQRGVILGQSTVGEVLMFWEDCSGY